MEKENNKKQKEDSIQSFVSKKSVVLKKDGVIFLKREGLKSLRLTNSNQ